jgi:hypothetical protein
MTELEGTEETKIWYGCNIVNVDYEEGENDETHPSQ